MSDIRNPTVHVPARYEYEPVFHSTTRCPRFPVATDAMPRSQARREGLSECPRCFEHRMEKTERQQAIRVESVASSMSASSTSGTGSGFSDFVVE